MSSYPDCLPEWAKASFDAAFTVGKVRLPFHSGFILAHSEIFAELPMDSELHRAGSREIPLLKDELEMARATLSQIYRRALGREGQTAFECPEAAVQVAAFAHKYAAGVLLADCDVFLSQWLPQHLSKQQEKQLVTSSSPVHGISAGLDKCTTWDLAAWMSWLEYFPEEMLPLLKEACASWLAVHPSVVDKIAEKLALLNSTTAAQVIKELAQELTWAQGKLYMAPAGRRAKAR